ncbi:ATP-binding protein [Streptomyces lunalinharesii]|uniref:ATP-binding protein n=1 Tax=Streptomyces lunalinharesii TaxID=333384 RepID=A0ABP6DZV0_9ACTN
MSTVDEEPVPPPHRPAREAYRFSVPSSSAAPKIAREVVARLLVLTGHARASETAQLLVSELVTNTHLHTRTRTIHLDVALGPCRVDVGVWDASPELRPAFRPGRDGAESGRGLLLVDALASGCGPPAATAGSACGSRWTKAARGPVRRAGPTLPGDLPRQADERAEKLRRIPVTSAGADPSGL